MNDIRIRLGKTDSVNSLNKQNSLDVELECTSKLSNFTNLKKTVDQYEQFKTERANCDNYRLIVTINPFCTNVLFNTLTEMVYHEGAVDCEVINDDDTSATKIVDSYGKQQPKRVGMLMNTEYSRPGCAGENGYYVYHPGYDIFDNHILRNKSFKIVNKPNHRGEDSFNTICDKMRKADGTDIKYRRRVSLDSGISGELDRHLYDYDDILGFENGDAINMNLIEENGWYGFINTSTIQSRDKLRDFDELNIGRVINYGKSCEFVDMYPDRTLYSFNPKYNEYRHREEYNWETFLTYPYERERRFCSLVDINVSDGEDGTLRRSALIILDAEVTPGSNGETVILFRSMLKHGLKRGDKVRFYYVKQENKTDENKIWTRHERDFTVFNVGDLNGNEKDYYFIINDLSFVGLINENLNSEKSDSELEVDETYEYRFVRIVGNVPSRYFIRKFRKLPNFKFAKSHFPSVDNDNIENYIDLEAKDGDVMIPFDKEQYKLAFENTIYNDASTQITFTDTIDTTLIKDDRGYPLTEIYFTVIKTNYGHDKWYGVSKTPGDEDVEYSHCFGKVSSGLDFSQTDHDGKRYLGSRTQTVNGNVEYIDTIENIRSYYGDIHLMRLDSSPYETDIDIRKNSNGRDCNIFYGDIVDYNSNESVEKVLQPFLHRFNTVQREYDTQVSDENKSKLTYHEIWSDDWDNSYSDNDSVGGRLIGTSQNSSFSVIEKEITPVNERLEGYYYNPYYPIQIKEFGEVKQSGHHDIIVSSIKPVQMDAIFLKVTSKTRSGVSKGDVIYLFDDEFGKCYDFIVTYVENRVTFYMKPYIKTTEGNDNPWLAFRSISRGWTWLDVCDKILDEESFVVLRRKNEEIPVYAERIGRNTYLWRDVLRVGDENVKSLPEYAYSNNAFYITREINFYLRRQDPQGWNKLLYDYSFPNDIYGKIRKESKHLYKDEREVIC